MCPGRESRAVGRRLQPPWLAGRGDACGRDRGAVGLVEILDRRAFALWNLKEYDKAIADFTKIVKEKPNDKAAYLDRSYVYELKGDLANGIADCDKVLSLDPKNEDATNRKARATKIT